MAYLCSVFQNFSNSYSIIQIKKEMKKLILMLAVASTAMIYSCTSNNTENTEAAEVVETEAVEVAPVEETEAPADSAANDSTVVVAVEEVAE